MRQTRPVPPLPEADASEGPAPEFRLAAHLRNALGAWPARAPFLVTGSLRRLAPSWDGVIRPVLGVSTPGGTVLSVPPQHVEGVRALGSDWRAPAFADGLNDVLGYAGERRHVLDSGGFYRWSVAPAPLPDAGEWVDPADPRVPDWLRPFNGGVLCAWDDEGRYGAGVGLKAHDALAHEIAVGTEPSLRGRGIARRLVVTAAREVLRRGAVPTYLHAPDNVASARVADASGFPDVGWRAVGFWPRATT